MNRTQRYYNDNQNRVKFRKVENDGQRRRRKNEVQSNVCGTENI